MGRFAIVQVMLIEDNSHYFFTRSEREAIEGIDSFIDQCGNTGGNQLVLSVNAMRTSYSSKDTDRAALNAKKGYEDHEYKSGVPRYHFRNA